MTDKLNKAQAAEYLGIKLKTLNEWMWKRKAPPSEKYLNRVYFKRVDLEAFKRKLTERRAC